MSMGDSYTVFFSPGLKVWNDDVSNPWASLTVPRVFRDAFKHSCLSYRSQNVTMDSGDTLNINPMTIGVQADTEDSFVFARVIGEIKITVSGAQSGHVYCYGSAYYPGVLILNSKAVDNYVIEAEEDSTVEFVSGLIVDSDDSRI